MEKAMKFIYATTLALCSLTAQAVNIPNQHQITYYNFNQSQTGNGLQNLQIDLKWLKEPDSNWGYYAQFFWRFEAEVGAYTGLQQDSYSSEKKKAIFSIWDKDSGHKVKMVTPWCKRFDWEGDGAQCIIQFNWVAGRTYSFRVQKEAGGVGGQRWASYVVDNVTDQKTQIGILEVPNYQGRAGSGDISTWGLATTAEFYVGDKNAPCSAVPYMGLEWNGPYGNDGKFTPYSTSTTYTGGVGAGCPNVNTQVIGPTAVRQEIGPGITNTNSNVVDLFRNVDRARYDTMSCLFTWIENAFPAATGQREVRRLSSMKDGNYMRDYRRGGQGFQLGVVDRTGEVFFLDGSGARYSFGNMSQYVEPLGCKPNRDYYDRF
jgi:hypothetical protein